MTDESKAVKRLSEELKKLRDQIDEITRAAGWSDEEMIKNEQLIPCDKLEALIRKRTEKLESELARYKKTVEALKTAKTTLQTALEQSHAGIAIADAKGDIKFINDAGLKIGGKSEKELTASINEYVGSWRLCRIDGTSLKKTETPLARAVLFGETISLEFMVRRADRDIVVWANAAPVRNDRGQITGGVAVFLDITDRMEAEEALRREKELTEAALNAQNDTFFVFDPSTGKAVRWNKAFTDIVGYTDEEIAALSAPQSYYDEPDQKKAAAAIAEMYAKGRATVEISLLTKQGKRIPTEYSISPLYNENGRLKYIISIGRDIRKRIF